MQHRSQRAIPAIESEPPDLELHRPLGAHHPNERATPIIRPALAPSVESAFPQVGISSRATAHHPGSELKGITA